ncbi:MAG TPA: glycosyltransferase [Acidimicrobiales bacterium]|nr:glycosyltransferase [Acidimicrobiales bacterium]
MRLAVLSFHTSPLTQPGTGDGGGMNVYVRELSSALAGAGVECEVFTRSWRRGLEPVIEVEPGFRVHHVPAGPEASVAKEELPEHLDEFTAGVLDRIGESGPADVVHANYWLSGMAGHTIKHRLELPLVSTFHTLARVKAEEAAEEHDRRAKAEAEVIGCSDAILANSAEEAAQLERLYGAVPDRIEVVPPGVDHHLFTPGDRGAARGELGLGDEPVLLFAGRIQPLKGADVAVRTLGCLLGPERPSERNGQTDTRPSDRAGPSIPLMGPLGPAGPAPTMLVVGGPSGVDGDAELARLHHLVAELGLQERVKFVPPQPHGRLALYYRAADVCLVPSRSESFGLVALEAAACGTPVVAAAVGGLRTIVTHGQTGFLVEGRDPAVYAAYVSRLLADPALAAGMSLEATIQAAGYRWSITAARLRRLYADVSARRLVECR